jgi:hypothetical protein
MLQQNKNVKQKTACQMLSFQCAENISCSNSMTGLGPSAAGILKEVCCLGGVVQALLFYTPEI